MSKEWNVLVVEDDADTAEMISAQLQQHTTRIARNGQEAILMAGANPPELVVLDLMMPELDGFETGRYLKHKFDDRSLCIMVLTAMPDRESRVECGKIGCEYFLQKPFDVDELVTTAGELIAVGRAESRLNAAHLAREAVAAETNKKKRKKLEAKLVDAAPIEDEICALRGTVATRLLDKGMPELAANHVSRIQTLRPDHPVLGELRKRL